MSCSAIPGLTGMRNRTSAEASVSGRHLEYHYILHSPHTGFLRSHSWPSQVATRKRHAVLSQDRNRNNWGDWTSNVERQRLQREVELQRQRLKELMQQQMQQRPAWQSLLLPAMGAGFFALLLGPLFAVVLVAAALGASLVFSTAAFFLLVPLAVATLALTFGLSAGAFVIKGIAFSVFNLVVVGGALAAGFKLTSRLLGTTLQESVDRQARAATSSSQPGTIDIEAKVIDERGGEEEDVARMNAEALRRFDQELEGRAKQRDIDTGERWKL
ncbi:hypothetical protein CVIRNUC_010980 [Coccomyxa viridis]|uniref:Oleosin n=1 Tax=Coccomyxa viridis TaxID=1274662 RepID=A0AAV1IKA6_9CHLO|nr:hypothetical protein CVIRNUC_010980 [Coccomyxa viridis]